MFPKTEERDLFVLRVNSSFSPPTQSFSAPTSVFFLQHEYQHDYYDLYILFGFIIQDEAVLLLQDGPMG